MFAVDGKDYKAVDTNLTFEICANKSSAVDIQIEDDKNLEKTETIIIEISEPSYDDIYMADVTGTIYIIDDDTSSE